MTCGLPCMKKVIDNCGALGAEAEALVIENFGSTFLAAEARALYVALEAVTDGFNALGLYVEEGASEEQAAKTKATIQAIIDESYKACDYAKELRTSRDALRRHGDGPSKSTANEIAVRCRAIRDEVVNVFQDIAAAGLRDAGYKVPAS